MTEQQEDADGLYVQHQYMCSECHQLFDTLEEVLVHQQSHTAAEADGEEAGAAQADAADAQAAGESQYQCLECGTLLRTPEELLLHQELHMREAGMETEHHGEVGGGVELGGWVKWRKRLQGRIWGREIDWRSQVRLTDVFLFLPPFSKGLCVITEDEFCQQDRRARVGNELWVSLTLVPASISSRSCSGSGVKYNERIIRVVKAKLDPVLDYALVSHRILAIFILLVSLS